MRHRSVIITILVAAVLVVGASMLSAEPDDDVVDLGEALDALAVLNAYFGHEPTPATATPVSTPDVPTSTPTPEPTPSPTLGELECRSRSSGVLGEGGYAHGIWGKQVVSQASRHLEVTFTNPTSETWRYGLTLAEFFYRYRNGDPPLWRIDARDDGTWEMNTLRSFGGLGYPDRLVDSGYFEDHGIPFNTGAGEKNRFTFYTQTELSPHRLFINGVEVPIPFADTLPQEAYEKYRYGRTYYIHAYDGNGYDGGVQYEGLCTQDSW